MTRVHRLIFLLKQVFTFPIMAVVVLFIWIQNRQWKVE